MKPSFTVAGVTFDTQEVYKGWNEYSDAALAQKIECDVVREGKLPHITDEAVLKKHGNLFQRFSEIAKKFDLPKQPLLGVSNYGFPFVATGTSGSIMMDSSVLKLLEPVELDGILAHEFSHLELKHNGKGDKHEVEFAADKLAAERTGDSKGLRSGLHKMDQFKEGLRQASFRYRMLEGTSLIATSIHDTFAGRHTRYPATSERIDRLEKLDPSFADREKGQSSSKRSGPG